MSNKRQTNRLSSLENLESRRPLAGDVMIVVSDPSGLIEVDHVQDSGAASDPIDVVPANSTVDDGTEPSPTDVADIESLSPADPAPIDEVFLHLHGDDHDGHAGDEPFDPTLPLAGDANRDGWFNSSDLIQVFQAGKYETGEFAVWEEGDFDGNGFFDTGDLIAAFQAGRYEVPPDDVFQDDPHADPDPSDPGESDPTDGGDNGGEDPGEAENSAVFKEEGARRAHHVIRHDDGGWTDEYQDYDKAGNPIGRTYEVFDKDGVLKERTVTRTNEGGGRTTTTETYDEDGKWTGTTREDFDKDGNKIGGSKATPDDDGGVSHETFDPENGVWVPADNATDPVQQPTGGRRADHHIGHADGGWTDEYVDLDLDGKSIGRTSESFNKRGMLTGRRTTRNGDDGSRTTTTESYDDSGKWTETTQETFDSTGKQTGGTRTTPDGQGGTSTQTYNPQTGHYE